MGVKTVRSEKEGADPASVAFDAVKTAKAEGIGTVLVDTAGRLQNKAGLMDQLGKIKRVIEKEAPVTEVLLVIDAQPGRNGMVQAKVFGEIVDVTGIVLTNLTVPQRAALWWLFRKNWVFPSSSWGSAKVRTIWPPSTPKASWMRCSINA